MFKIGDEFASVGAVITKLYGAISDKFKGLQVTLNNQTLIIFITSDPSEFNISIR